MDVQKPKRTLARATISKRQGEGSWGESHNNPPFDGSPGDESLTAPVLAPVADPVQPARPAGVTNREVPAAHKMKIGDWIAQWDEEYQAWFFYNAITEISTWIKPKELWHVSFNKPRPLDQQSHLNTIDTISIRDYQDTSREQSRNNDGIDEKVFLASDANGTEFFGFDIPQGKVDPYTGDVSLDPWTAFYDSLTGIYDNIVKDYVEDIYEDVIEGYTLATVKLLGWFFFGSMLVAKGAFLDTINAGRSLDGPLEMKEFKVNMSLPFNLPMMESIPSTFSLDNSLLSCYGNRYSCVNDNLPGEVDHLISNIVGLKRFASNWMDLGEKIRHIAVEGDTMD